MVAALTLAAVLVAAPPDAGATPRKSAQKAAELFIMGYGLRGGGSTQTLEALGHFRACLEVSPDQSEYRQKCKVQVERVVDALSKLAAELLATGTALEATDKLAALKTFRECVRVAQEAAKTREKCQANVERVERELATP